MQRVFESEQQWFESKCNLLIINGSVAVDGTTTERHLCIAGDQCAADSKVDTVLCLKLPRVCCKQLGSWHETVNKETVETNNTRCEGTHLCQPEGGMPGWCHFVVPGVCQSCHGQTSDIGVGFQRLVSCARGTGPGTACTSGHVFCTNVAARTSSNDVGSKVPARLPSKHADSG